MEQCLSDDELLYDYIEDDSLYSDVDFQEYLQNDYCPESFEDNEQDHYEAQDQPHQKALAYPGRGRLFQQHNRSSRKAPNMKGFINLGGVMTTLSAWVRANKNGNRYIMILASIKQDAQDGSAQYKQLGQGFLRTAKQNSAKEPVYRGQLSLGEDVFSLSAWSNKSEWNLILSLYSYQMKKTSYLDSQKELKSLDDAR